MEQQPAAWKQMWQSAEEVDIAQSHRNGPQLSMRHDDDDDDDTVIETNKVI